MTTNISSFFDNPQCTGVPSIYDDYSYPDFESAAIVIDNGSFSCKAGWSVEELPRLNFRSLVGRLKKDQPPAVGNQMTDSDLIRLNARSPFDRNIVYDFELQEQLLDHIFSSLGINDESIMQPVVMTEAPCNPNYCRRQLNELLFEVYRVPAVCYGVDALFSYYYNTTRDGYSVPDGLLLSSGFTTTHVMPVVGNRFDPTNCRRMPLGGFHCTDTMLKLMELKYPQWRSAVLTANRAQELKERFCCVAEDYVGELGRMAADEDYCRSTAVRTIQLPFDPVQGGAAPSALMSEEEQKAKQQLREQRGQRLREYAQKKRQEKADAYRLQLDELLAAKASKESDPDEFAAALERFELRSEAQLDGLITALKNMVRELEAKITGVAPPPEDSAPQAEEVAHDDKYPLLSVPDDQLSPEELKEKKKQKTIKAMAEGRAKKKKEKEAAATAGGTQPPPEAEVPVDPEQKLLDLKQKRMALSEKIENRKRRQIGLSQRGSAVSKQRLRMLAMNAFQTAKEVQQDKVKAKKKSAGPAAGGAKKPRKGSKAAAAAAAAAQQAAEGDSDQEASVLQTGMEVDEDTFGVNDEDWSIYRQMSKDSDSDEGDDEIRLAELDAQILDLDPEWTAFVSAVSAAEGKASTHPLFGGPWVKGPVGPEESARLRVCVERVRVPEVMFEPHMIGMDCAGLAETSLFVLNKYSKPTRDSIVKSVFVTGGNCSFEGIQERLTRELCMSLPFGAEIKVIKAQDTIFDAWKGAAYFAQQEFFRDAQLTRLEYDEYGPDYMKEHMASNTFFPTPGS